MLFLSPCTPDLHHLPDSRCFTTCARTATAVPWTNTVVCRRHYANRTAAPARPFNACLESTDDCPTPLSHDRSHARTRRRGSANPCSHFFNPYVERDDPHRTSSSSTCSKAHGCRSGCLTMSSSDSRERSSCVTSPFSLYFYVSDLLRASHTSRESRSRDEGCSADLFSSSLVALCSAPSSLCRDSTSS